MRLKHIISIHDMKKEEILKVLEIAKRMEEKPQKELLKGKVLANLFFEPSTRTRLSFESAMLRLGGEIMGFSDPKGTSGQKGETVTDTAKMAEKYADVIVVRHSIEGAPRAISESVNIPVLNGGDGSNQHPTQTLLDLYTIQKTQNKLEGLKIALVGDLKYGRTVHSLAIALSLFEAKLYFVAPEILKMPSYIIDDLKKKGIDYSFHEKIEEVINEVDILYMTRIQKERFTLESDYERVKNKYVLKKKMLEHVKPTMKVMHPLPRVNEIHPDVDNTPYAAYFEQAGNGVFVRQALLALVLGVIE